MFLRFSMSSLATLASVLTHCEDTNHNSVRPTMASYIGATAIVTIIVKATDDLDCPLKLDHDVCVRLEKLLVEGVGEGHFLLNSDILKHTTSKS